MASLINLRRFPSTGTPDRRFKARDFQDVREIALAYYDPRPAGDGVTIELPYKIMTANKDLPVNIATTAIEGNNAIFDHGSLGAAEFMKLTAQITGTGNLRSHMSRPRAIRNFGLVGPGKTIAGSANMTTDSITSESNKIGVRANVENISFIDSEANFIQKNGSYLAILKNPSFYRSRFGIWQQAGSDSGENSSTYGAVFDGVDLQNYLQDNSSEWWHFAPSFDYSNQLLVATGSYSLMCCYAGRFEPRGSLANGDTLLHSVLGGYGGDARASVPGYDSFVHLLGDGAGFYWFGGPMDINSSGSTASPYEFDHIFNAAHRNSKAIIYGSFPRNMLNKGKKIWTGAGLVRFVDSALSSFPNLPQRVTDQARGNKLQDGNATDGSIEDLWFIYSDTASQGMPQELTSAAGGPTTYTASADASITGYVAGQAYRFTPNVSSSGSPTININSLGAKNVLNFTGFSAGAFTAGVKTQFVYDGTAFRQQDNQRTIGTNVRFERSTAAGTRVDSYSITNPGAGYTGTPTLTCSNASVQLSPIMSGGKLIGVVIDNPGYNLGGTAPTVTVSGGNPTTPATVTLAISGAGHWRITKVGGTGTAARIAVAVPCRPGEQVPTFGRISIPASGGVTGKIYAEMRFVKIKGYNGMGRPEVGNAGATLYSASKELPNTSPSAGVDTLTTAKWFDWSMKTFDAGANGDPNAPEWVTHAVLIINADAGSAGVIDLCDLMLGSL